MATVKTKADAEKQSYVDIDGANTKQRVSIVDPVSFETDTSGSTAQYNDTATTSPANIPSSAGSVISNVLLRNTNTSNVDLLLSLDGGTTFFTIPPQHQYEGSPQGDLTQIIVKSSSSTCNYESIVDFKV